jgi:hypothetical protein
VKNRFLVIIIGMTMLIGSVVSASAATLVWNQGTAGAAGKPAGYIVAHGASSGSYTVQDDIIDSDSCVPGTAGTPYDCSMPVPSIPVGTTVWFSVRAYNNQADGSPCAALTCTSDWAIPVSYTNNGSGQTGTKPTIPTTVRLGP